MKQINAQDSVYTISTEYPEIINILVDFGFTQIRLPQMIQTAGKIMTLKKGCMMRGFDYRRLKEILYEKGYEIIE